MPRNVNPPSVSDLPGLRQLQFVNANIRRTLGAHFHLTGRKMGEVIHEWVEIIVGTCKYDHTEFRLMIFLRRIRKPVDGLSRIRRGYDQKATVSSECKADLTRLWILIPPGTNHQVPGTIKRQLPEVVLTACRHPQE